MKKLLAVVAAVTLIVSIGTWANASVIVVEIDVKPDSDPNCFNNNGHGVIPVAILTTETFDASDIDPATLEFKEVDDGFGFPLIVKTRGNGQLLCGLEDIDNDGDLDLVCHFEDEEFAFSPDADSAGIDGELFDGTPFWGADTVCIVP